MVTCRRALEKHTTLSCRRLEHKYIVFCRRLCQQTKSLQETRVSFSAAGFSGFFKFFCIKPNLRNISPYGAGHKLFEPTCSVASPPTNDTFSFLKKFKGRRRQAELGGPTKKSISVRNRSKKFFILLYFS